MLRKRRKTSDSSAVPRHQHLVPTIVPAEEKSNHRLPLFIDDICASPWIGLHYRHEFLLHLRHELLVQRADDRYGKNPKSSKKLK